jgi:hypothetical protein
MTAEEIGRYRRWPIARDLSIGGGGGLAAAVFGSLPNLATWVAVIFWVLAAIFAGFAAITLVRAFSRVSVEAEGLRMRGPLPRLVRWDAISVGGRRFVPRSRGHFGDPDLSGTDDLAVAAAHDPASTTYRRSDLSPMTSLSPLHTASDLREVDQAGRPRTHGRHAAPCRLPRSQPLRSTPIRSNCRAACASAR